MTKGQEALNRICEEFPSEELSIYHGYTTKELREDLIAIEKELKALEIVKEKKVSIRLFNACSCVEQYNDETLNLRGLAYGLPKLTQQEFELLKEMLE